MTRMRLVRDMVVTVTASDVVGDVTTGALDNDKNEFNNRIDLDDRNRTGKGVRRLFHSKSANLILSTTSRQTDHLYRGTVHQM